MSHLQPEQIQQKIHEILGEAVDMNRPLRIKERYAVDDLLDQLYRTDSKQYFSIFSSYSSFIGDMKGLEQCVDYFFSSGTPNLNDGDVLQCIYSLNNAAYFERIYSLLKDCRVEKTNDIELIKVFVNSAAITLNISCARKTINETAEYLKDADSYVKMASLVAHVENFCESYIEPEILDFQKYIVHLLKIHRNKIIPKVYAIAGPSIVNPSFFYDEGNEFISLSLRYVSDDVDKAIELEEVFYDSIETHLFKNSSINTISYNLQPISTDNNVSFGKSVIEVEMK